MFDFATWITRRQVVGGAAAVGAVAFADTRAARSVDTKRLRMRTPGDLTSLDAAFVVAAHLQVRWILQAIFPNLIRYVPGTEWATVPSAAEVIEQVDPTHTRFKLKPGMTWSNGYGEVSAEDVKFSFERIRDGEAAGMVDYQSWELLDTVEVVGPLEGVIVTKEPVANLWTLVLPNPSGTIVCKKAWAEHGFTQSNAGIDVPTDFGPYRMKQWDQGQGFVLERNPNWTGETAFTDDYAYFDEIDFVLIAEDKTAELALLAGEVDITNVAPSSVPNLRETMPSDTRLEVRPTTGVTWLGMNVDHEPFDDIRVRRAIQMTVDPREIIDAAYFGQAPLSTGIIAPGLLGHREAEVPEPDIDSAKGLLAEAGLADGFQTTITCRNTTELVAAAQVIAAQLSQLGIEAEVHPYDDGTYWDLGLESKGDAWKDLQLILAFWTLGADPGHATMWFVNEQVGEWNWERWRSDEFTELNAKAAVEIDTAKRDQIYKRMMDLMWESAAYVPITHEPWVVIYRDGLIPNFFPDGSVAVDLISSTM